MDRAVTILVVGAGGFGRNYLKVLAALHEETGPDLPRIDTLVVSRTRLERAEATAADVAARPACSFKQVAGVEVRDVTQLKAVLNRYRPDLTCIVARDRKIGDDIHALYALPALDAGAVLCEKPFCHARGDGAGLEKVRALLAHAHADRFGLELPLAVMAGAMAADQRLGPMLGNARRIRFVWQKQQDGTDLIDDLVLHPWSLLPAAWQVAIDRVKSAPGHAKLDLHLTPDRPGTRSVSGHIHLSAGGVFRGMCIDAQPFEFVFAQGQLQCWQHQRSWEEVIAGRAVTDGRRRMVLAVANPLARHIQSALAGRPLVDVQRTWQSQQFLEASKWSRA